MAGYSVICEASPSTLAQSRHAWLLSQTAGEQCAVYVAWLEMANGHLNRSLRALIRVRSKLVAGLYFGLCLYLRYFVGPRNTGLGARLLYSHGCSPVGVCNSCIKIKIRSLGN